MAIKIVPSRRTVEEMAKEVEECEQKVRVQTEPEASKLEEKAALLREWITSLKTGRWTS